MKDYELTYLIKTDVAGEEIKSLLEKISDLIKSQEGIIKRATEASKKKLGYQIKRKTEAYLVSIDFSLNPDNLKNLENIIKEQKEILRHIIVVKEKERIITPRSIESTTTKKIEKKTDLEDIDEKIEEILK
jgi:ribosomal protein S6